MARILIVEDDAELRDTICTLLAEENHETVAAGNGEAGLKLLEDSSIDLALIDIWMPEMGGLAVLKEVRARNSSVPILLMSGGSPGESLEHVSALGDTYGANSFIFKPFDGQELHAMVGSLLNSTATGQVG